MSVNLSPLAGAGWQFFDNNGIPLSGGLIYTYAASSSTPQATYNAISGLIANANPIVLDAAGRVPNEIWLTPGLSYKFVLQTSSSVQIASWDNITGINDAASITAANLSVTGNLSVAGVVSGTGFTNLFASPPPIGSTTPANGTFTNLTATVSSTLVTPAQFDNSTSGATTAFVQRAIGNASAITTISTTTTLTAAAAGSLIYCTPSANIVITLPTSVGLAVGTQINFVNINPYTVQLHGNGSDVINFIGSGSSVSPVLLTNDTATLIWTGGVWNVIAGSIEWQYQSARFGSNLSANGYQKLPSGLIIQWGTISSSGTGANNAVVTYPTAFPNITFQTYATVGGNPTSGTYTVHAGGTTPSGANFTVLLNGATISGVGINWLALGY